MPNAPHDHRQEFLHEERHHALGPAREARITICGAGALGANLVETLARMGFAQLRVIDRDRVERRNLSTQPYLSAEIGALKAQSLVHMLYRALGARVEPVAMELTATNADQLLGGAQLVVDAFDNREARALVSSVARACGVPCLHVGFSGDGQYGNGIWEPEYQVPGQIDGDPCDYPLTRPFALVVAALAARSLHTFLCEGIVEHFEITWGDLRISTARMPPEG